MLEKIDLHGLQVKEAEEVVTKQLETIKHLLEIGKLSYGPKGVYNYSIITVLLRIMISFAIGSGKTQL